MPATLEQPQQPRPAVGAAINRELYEAIAASAAKAMDMCGMKVRATGMSCVPTASTGVVTGMIGVHGKVTGFATVNMAERFALAAVGGLLGEQYDRLASQVIDGAGEITNIIVGGIKSIVAGSKWQFSHITVPTVIVGQNFTIAYSRGLEYLTASFEHEDPDSIRLEDRMMHISLSLLTL